MRNYLSRHLQVLFATLGSMRRTPMTSINTILVIAITLLLPCALYIAIKSAQSLSGDWQGRPQISIFMQTDLPEAESLLIFEELRLHPAIELAEFITPKQALDEFRSMSEIGFEIDFLDENPLPASVVVMPDSQNVSSEALLELKEELAAIDGIDNIRLDLDWTDRFNAILGSAIRIVTLLSGLLAIALILIVSNTIKLLILNRRQEIEITRLVGGSNAFVRRPFLYYGLLFGAFGAIVTLLLMSIASKLIEEPLSLLANLYQKESLLYALETSEIFTIILIGSVLGWLAARWSVAQHLWKIKPQ
ncbi:MAG: cell division transport system permease protein [Parvicella sp.]|jgi:cell division transport system permease protein